MPPKGKCQNRKRQSSLRYHTSSGVKACRLRRSSSSVCGPGPLCLGCTSAGEAHRQNDELTSVLSRAWDLKHRLQNPGGALDQRAVSVGFMQRGRPLGVLGLSALASDECVDRTRGKGNHRSLRSKLSPVFPRVSGIALGKPARATDRFPSGTVIDRKEQPRDTWIRRGRAVAFYVRLLGAGHRVPSDRRPCRSSVPRRCLLHPSESGSHSKATWTPSGFSVDALRPLCLFRGWGRSAWASPGRVPPVGGTPPATRRCGCPPVGPAVIQGEPVQRLPFRRP
jgi:hypothetical protein